MGVNLFTDNGVGTYFSYNGFAEFRTEILKLMDRRDAGSALEEFILASDVEYEFDPITVKRLYKELSEYDMSNSKWNEYFQDVLETFRYASENDYQVYIM